MTIMYYVSPVYFVTEVITGKINEVVITETVVLVGSVWAISDDRAKRLVAGN